MKSKMNYKLKRDMGLFQATLYGVGIIIGAGIYVLIGIGSGIAGNAVWLSFLVAAFIATFTALSYAELSSMFPKEAAEFVYTRNAFRKKSFAFVISWTLLITGIIAGATVALGFGGYFVHLTGIGSPFVVAIGLILVMSVINYVGIEKVAKFNDVAAMSEIVGLIIIIVAGLYVFSISGVSVDFFAMPNDFSLIGIMTATSVIFFAYIGFEEIANISEEIKNPKKTLPKALILSIVISTILYILVTVSAVAAVGWEKLSTSAAPLSETLSAIWGPYAGLFISIFALLATSNTVLITMVTMSRVLYGMGCQGSIHEVCSRVGRYGTPYVSVGIVAVLSILALFIGGIGFIAKLTDIGIFVVYIAVNLSLIKLRFSEPKTKRPFKSPLNIGKIPLLAIFGVLACGFMLVLFEPILLLYEAIIMAAGYVVYRVYKDVEKYEEKSKLKKNKTRALLS